jgi:UDP-glucose 4-epimerase
VTPLLCGKIIVDDLVSAIMKLIQYEGPHSIFNVGSGSGHSVLDILNMLSNTIGHLPKIEHLPARDFDVPSNILNSQLLEKEVGWQPEVSLQQGIVRVVDSLKKQQSTKDLHP